MHKLILKEFMKLVKLLLKYYELLTTYDADSPNDGKQINDILSKIPKPKITPNESNEQQTQSTTGQQNNNDN